MLQVVTSVSKQHIYNDRLYIVDNSNNDGGTIHITVGDNISKRIKTFDKNRELPLIPVHCVMWVTVHACEVNNYNKSRISEPFTYLSTSSIFLICPLFHFVF